MDYPEEGEKSAFTPTEQGEIFRDVFRKQSIYFRHVRKTRSCSFAQRCTTRSIESELFIVFDGA